MNLIDKNTTTGRLLIISVILALFIIYPNIACFSWDMNHMPVSEHLPYILFFIFRYVYFLLFIFLLLHFNLHRFETEHLRKRLMLSLMVSTIAYGAYVLISLLSSSHRDCFTSILLFQFVVVCIIGTFLGHLSHMYSEQVLRENEIEKLRFENLQSRCDALTNQINPHFFFNSLNGLTSLIRKKNDEDAIAYVDKLSDVFRYILQSDKKGLVTLGEELEFVNAFFYMMEVRFASKLEFCINVADDKKDLMLPVLSLLPVIDNIVVHNIIDSDHKMTVNICLNDQMELSVSNPVFPKITTPETNGSGLKNLESRFQLMMNSQIRINNDGIRFTVYLPLKKSKDENTDC